MLRRAGHRRVRRPVQGAAAHIEADALRFLRRRALCRGVAAGRRAHDRPGPPAPGGGHGRKAAAGNRLRATQGVLKACETSRNYPPVGVAGGFLYPVI